MTLVNACHKSEKSENYLSSSFFSKAEDGDKQRKK